MPGSPVPIYLGCAGLIVGSLGLGAQHMLGGNSVSATNTTEQPLFARSVEEASLPATGWPSQNVSVAHYEPMVELLTTPARSTQPPAGGRRSRRRAPPMAQQPQQEPRAAPREIVRDLSQPQGRQSRRARDTRETAASTEQADPREARTQERQRNAAQAETDKRDGGSRRSERRYRDRDDAEAVDMRSRPDRRQRDGERVVVREEIREPEQRVVRGPEQRDGGFSPFRLFGIFDR